MKRILFLLLLLVLSAGTHANAGGPDFWGGAAAYWYRTVYIPANQTTPTATNFATSGTTEYGTNNVNMDYCAFDGATREYREFCFVMPEQWDRSTVKVKYYWAPGSSACTASDTVEWAVAAEAISNDGALDVASGTSKVISDVVLVGKAGDLHISNATAALTIAGTPASGDLIHFKVSRNVDGVDDMTEDAWLFGVFIQIKEAILAPAW